MVAAGEDRVFEMGTADDALEGKVIVFGVVDFVTLGVVVVGAVATFFELAFYLPAVFVVGAVVQEFAAVAETAEAGFLIVRRTIRNY